MVLFNAESAIAIELLSKIVVVLEAEKPPVLGRRMLVRIRIGGAPKRIGAFKKGNAIVLRASAARFTLTAKFSDSEFPLVRLKPRLALPCHRTGTTGTSIPTHICQGMFLGRKKTAALGGNIPGLSHASTPRLCFRAVLPNVSPRVHR